MGIVAEFLSPVAGGGARVEITRKACSTVPGIEQTWLVFVLLVLAGFENFLKFGHTVGDLGVPVFTF